MEQESDVALRICDGGRERETSVGEPRHAENICYGFVDSNANELKCKLMVDSKGGKTLIFPLFVSQFGKTEFLLFEGKNEFCLSFLTS